MLPLVCTLSFTQTNNNLAVKKSSCKLFTLKNIFSIFGQIAI